MKYTVRNLLDSHTTITLKKLAGYVTKKYVGGKRNTGIPRKDISVVSFCKPTNNGFAWHNDGLDSDNYHTIVYFGENVIDDQLISMHIKHETFDVRYFTRPFKGFGSSPRDKAVSIDLEWIRESYGLITDEAYFLLSTAIDLHGLTKNELHYVMKISNAMKVLP